MSKLAHSHPEHESPGVTCEYCGDLFDAKAGTISSRAAWELDLTLCDCCADEAFETIADNGQFGLGA